MVLSMVHSPFYAGAYAFGRRESWTRSEVPVALPRTAFMRIHLWALSAFSSRVYVSAMPLSAADYRPRDSEHTVLYRVIDEHLEAFLETARRNADGSPLPEFVEQEFRDFLTCGLLAHGFARLRCTDCAFERLVPFSCKGRGFCPSCGGRRMTECAARLVDDVLPRVPVRQWVLSLPHRLRYHLAWDHALARAVLGVYVRVLLGFQRRRARRHGIRNGRSGCATVIQRFGGGLNLNIHFHTLLFDGVFFAEGEKGTLGFWPLPPPTDEEVGTVLARIAARVQRLLKRCRRDPSDADLSPPDPVVEESPVLAGISSASIQGRIALGARAGARVWRVGDDPDAPWVLSTAPRHAHLAGFDLHANVAVPAADRTRLEQLCRYLLRPGWLRTGSGSWPMAASRSRSRPPGWTARTTSCSSPWSCSRSSPRSRRGRGSTSCSTTACSRRMPAGVRA
jgi:hypothetical protein